MTKQKANDEYRAGLARHKAKTWPMAPRIAIFGSGSGNIGEAIFETLSADPRYLPPPQGKPGLPPLCKYTEKDLTLPIRKEIDAEMKIASQFDGFVFNNGANHLDWIEDWSRARIEDVIYRSLVATINSISAIAKARMESPHRTKIVVIGSMAHSAVLNGSAPYCAAKAGLQHFVRCAAYELAPKGFEVFQVNPSNVQDAPMSRATIEGLSRYRRMSIGDAEKYWANECPLGDFLTKGEIADMVKDLLLLDRKYLSGSAIDLKGAQR